MTILLEREGVRNFCANFTPFLFNFSFEYWDWKESWAFDMDIYIFVGPLIPSGVHRPQPHYHTSIAQL